MFFLRFSFGAGWSRILSVTNSVSVSAYGGVSGDTKNLPIGLGVNVLDIGVFYCHYPPSLPPTALHENGSVAVIVTSIRASNGYAPPVGSL